jgi:hypothetical protein
MKNFKIVPLSKEFAEKIRANKKDNYGHEVIEQLSNGLGPCRVSLKPFVPGVDKRLLFAHSPFTIANAYDQPGPVFIHAGEVEEYADIYCFPPEIKADKKHFHLTLIGYDKAQMMIYTKLVGDEDIDNLVEKIFNEKSDVAYLHARSAEACCYICKIERL